MNTHFFIIRVKELNPSFLPSFGNYLLSVGGKSKHARRYFSGQPCLYPVDMRKNLAPLFRLLSGSSTEYGCNRFPDIGRGDNQRNYFGILYTFHVVRFAFIFRGLSYSAAIAGPTKLHPCA